MRPLNEVIQEQEKRLRWLDSADAKLSSSVYAYAEKRLADMGVNLNYPPHGGKASNSLASMIVGSLSGGYPLIHPRDVVVVKSLIGDILNRKNGETRRASNDVKSKTIELTKAGENALKAWKRSTKSSYSLIVESLLLDSGDLYQDLKVRSKRQMEVISELKESVTNLNNRIKELQVQLADTGVEKLWFKRENERLKSQLEHYESGVTSQEASGVTEANEKPIDEVALGEQKEAEAKLPIEDSDNLDVDSVESDSRADITPPLGVEGAPGVIGPRTESLRDEPQKQKRLRRQKGLGNGHSKGNQKGKRNRTSKKR